MGDVQASQRERLLRSVIAAVAEASYPVVTVAGIVRRARVSRAAFYAHIADKEACFLAATREAGDLMRSRMAAAVRALPPGAPDEQALRAALRAFLEFFAAEPAVAKVFYMDMPGAGPLADERHDAAIRMIADQNRKWHERARARHPEWPAVPGEAYLALSGAAVELIRAVVRTGDTGALPGLEEPIMSLYLAVLAARPWTP
jgi:AcrR family transcriptional regulator